MTTERIKDQSKHNITDEEIAAALAEEQAAKKNPWIGKAIVIGLAVVAVLIYMAIPGVHEWVNNVVDMFKHGNFSEMKEFIGKYGKWAMLVSGLLMIFQSIAAPLPAFFITLTNANLFGWWQGCILSWVSSMMGAVLCFYIARILGRDVVEKICTKGALLSIEQFFDKHGKKCILIARLLPFISFDVVSYAAGLTSMDFWGFFIATGVGQMPACIVYSYVGGMLTGGARMMFLGLVCLFALAIMVILFRQLYTANEQKKKEAAEAAGVEYEKPKFSFTRLFTAIYGCAFIAMTVSTITGYFPSFVVMCKMGWTFLGVWVALALALYFRKSAPIGNKFIAGCVVINVIAQMLMLGLSSIPMAVAARFREGLMLPLTLSLGTISTAAIGAAVVFGAVVVVMNLMAGKKAANK